MGNTEQFDRMAGHYDTPQRIRMAKITADAIRADLLDVKDKTAIDFGCGTGLIGLELAEDFRSILLLDASQNMVDIAEKKILDLKIPNAQAVCVDFETADHPDLQTDYIVMVNVLIHIKDYRSVLSMLYKRLTPGGHLLIADFDKNDQINSELVHNGFEQDSLQGILGEIGFRDVKSRTFFTGTNLFMDKDASIFLLDAQK